jgi:hypothetical protein
VYTSYSSGTTSNVVPPSAETSGFTTAPHRGDDGERRSQTYDTSAYIKGTVAFVALVVLALLPLLALLELLTAPEPGNE